MSSSEIFYSKLPTFSSSTNITLSFIYKAAKSNGSKEDGESTATPSTRHRQLPYQVPLAAGISNIKRNQNFAAQVMATQMGEEEEEENDDDLVFANTVQSPLAFARNAKTSRPAIPSGNKIARSRSPGGDNKEASALRDELDFLQDENENILEKVRVEDGEISVSRVKELENQVYGSEVVLKRCWLTHYWGLISSTRWSDTLAGMDSGKYSGGKWRLTHSKLQNP